MCKSNVQLTLLWSNTSNFLNGESMIDVGVDVSSQGAFIPLRGNAL